MGVAGAAPHAYEGIAAVTTTVDGSRSADAPVAIVVNPMCSETGPRRRPPRDQPRVDHVATAATTVTMPLWVAEGFADYVVGAVDVPPRVSARAAVRDIRTWRPGSAARQRRVPGRPGVEAADQQSWLAIRLIARETANAGWSRSTRRWSSIRTRSGLRCAKTSVLDDRP